MSFRKGVAKKMTRKKRASAEEVRAELRAVVGTLERDRAAALLRVLVPRSRSGQARGNGWTRKRARRRKLRDQAIAVQARQGDAKAVAQRTLRILRQRIYRAVLRGDAEAVAQLEAERAAFKAQRGR